MVRGRPLMLPQLQVWSCSMLPGPTPFSTWECSFSIAISFVTLQQTKLMAIENEHSHVENGVGPGSMEQLHTCNWGSISGLPFSIKIAWDPHHHACPIEQVIQLHDIPDLVSSICRMWGLNGYDGSMMGCQWEYTIEQLPAEYKFLDMWDTFQLAPPACNKSEEEEF